MWPVKMARYFLATRRLDFLNPPSYQIPAESPANIGTFMRILAKRYGSIAIFSLAAFSGSLLAFLPNNAYEISFYEDDGNLVGFDSYYCGMNHHGLDWGVRTDNVVYVDLGLCYVYSPEQPGAP